MKKSQKPTNEMLVQNNATESTARHSAAATDKPEAISKKKKVAAKTKVAGRYVNKMGSNAKTENGKLICRYCGSDDLAPSFIKRRDARCRACFKKRYGSAKRAQPNRKVAGA
jgi:hypothetical protein